jgi:hypothetical protein
MQLRVPYSLNESVVGLLRVFFPRSGYHYDLVGGAELGREYTRTMYLCFQAPGDLPEIADEGRWRISRYGEGNRVGVNT